MSVKLPKGKYTDVKLHIYVSVPQVHEHVMSLHLLLRFYFAKNGAELCMFVQSRSTQNRSQRPNHTVKGKSLLSFYGHESNLTIICSNVQQYQVETYVKLREAGEGLNYQ